MGEEKRIISIDLAATGQNIWRLMDEKHVSVKTVSAAAGISDQAVYKWLNGAALPTIENALVLSNLLDTDINDMIVRAA